MKCAYQHELAGDYKFEHSPKYDAQTRRFSRIGNGVFGSIIGILIITGIITQISKCNRAPTSDAEPVATEAKVDTVAMQKYNSAKVAVKGFRAESTR